MTLVQYCSRSHLILRKKIILCATLDPESDCGEFTYDYVDKHGHQHWVTETADASARLLDLLVELRNFFVDNFKSQEKPFWHGCEVTVNIENKYRLQV